MVLELPPIENREIEQMAATACELLDRLEFVAQPTLSDQLLAQNARFALRLAGALKDRESDIQSLRLEVATLQHEAEVGRQGFNAALQETHEIYREAQDAQNARYQVELQQWRDGYKDVETQLSAAKNRLARHLPEVLALPSSTHA